MMHKWCEFGVIWQSTSEVTDIEVCTTWVKRPSLCEHFGWSLLWPCRYETCTVHQESLLYLEYEQV